MIKLLLEKKKDTIQHKKFNLIFKAITHNCNTITKYASRDLIIDKTTQAHREYIIKVEDLIKNRRETKLNKGWSNSYGI